MIQYERKSIITGPTVLNALDTKVLSMYGPMISSSKLNKNYLDYAILKILFCIVKMHTFQGDLSNESAETKALVWTGNLLCVVHPIS